MRITKKWFVKTISTTDSSVCSKERNHTMGYKVRKRWNIHQTLMHKWNVGGEVTIRGITFSNLGIDRICQVIPCGIIIIPKSRKAEAYINTCHEIKGQLRLDNFAKRVTPFCDARSSGATACTCSTFKPILCPTSTPLPSVWISLPQALEKWSNFIQRRKEIRKDTKATINMAKSHKEKKKCIILISRQGEVAQSKFLGTPLCLCI